MRVKRRYRRSFDCCLRASSCSVVAESSEKIQTENVESRIAACCTHSQQTLTPPIA
jgi:hypothetical protein